MPRCFLLGIFLLLAFSAKANFDFNPNCLRAYNSILSLKLSDARVLIAAEKRQNPRNAIPVLLENYLDYFELLTSESKADFERLKRNKSARIARLEAENRASPYYLYSLAQVNLQWAIIRGKFQEYLAAGLEINRANNMLKENAKKFPAFLPNQKELGIIHTLLGSLPESLKASLGILGIRGNAQEGVRILEGLVRTLPKSPYAYYYDETVFFLAFIQIQILQDAGAYDKIIRNTEAIDQGSLLRTYIRAYAAMRTAHNDDAIAELLKRPSGGSYQPYPYLDYLLGIAKMHRLDRSAGADLATYLKSYKGINFVKDAYLNLAWLALLRAEEQTYDTYITLVKSQGFALDEKDKQAMREAADPPPHIDLLKARLLFDGGYYQQAESILSSKKPESFRSQKDKLEYFYRSGRIYDMMGKEDLAIRFYQSTINAGKGERYYFAANSALNAAIIYERQKNNSQARHYYQTAIGMKNHDYETGIENKAKEGLRRIGG